MQRALSRDRACVGLEVRAEYSLGTLDLNLIDWLVVGNVSISRSSKCLEINWPQDRTNQVLYMYRYDCFSSLMQPTLHELELALPMTV